MIAVAIRQPNPRNKQRRAKERKPNVLKPSCSKVSDYAFWTEFEAIERIRNEIEQ